MKKDIEWLKEKIGTEMIQLEPNRKERWSDVKYQTLRNVAQKIDQLDEPEVLSQEWISDNAVVGQYPDGMGYVVPAYKLQNLLVPEQEEVDRVYRKGFKEGERQTAEYFESVTEEPSYAQVQKYLSEHGIKIADKEPETVEEVVADFGRSLERLRELWRSMGVEEMEK